VVQSGFFSRALAWYLLTRVYILAPLLPRVLLISYWIERSQRICRVDTLAFAIVCYKSLAIIDCWRSLDLLSDRLRGRDLPTSVPFDR